MRSPKTIAVLSWLSLLLALHLCTHDICRAQQEDQGAPPDTSRADLPEAEVREQVFPFSAASDSLMQVDKDQGKPIYTTWWFWAIGVALIGTAVAILIGQDGEAEEKLPDFPDPPER